MVPIYADIAWDWIEHNKERLANIADQIWDFAEIGLEEYSSSKLLMAELEREGFAITENIAGMPTAFKAVWGSGKPVIGLLGEYDALIASSQKRGLTVRGPVEQGAPGHACGHNLLGVAMMACSIAIKKEMEQKSLSGTVIFFGCPAEELLLGKIHMAREGVFDGLDFAYTWHPSDMNYPDETIFQAMYNVKFDFYGTASHPSANPEQGRSALDAVELMNVGVNYMREHMIPGARIHYSITNGGGPPNTIPDYAQVWYYVRGPKAEMTKTLYKRVLKIAEAAAMMTETRVEPRPITACHENVTNDVLLEVLHDAMKATPPQAWDEDDYKLAGTLADTFDSASYQKALDEMAGRAGLDSDLDKLLFGKPIPLTGEHLHIPAGSSDFGEVSWVAPTAQTLVACCPVSTPFHSWQMTVSAGSGIGSKGMIYAARLFAYACLTLLHDPEKVRAAQEEFRKRTNGKPFVSLLG